MTIKRCKKYWLILIYVLLTKTVFCCSCDIIPIFCHSVTDSSRIILAEVKSFSPPNPFGFTEFMAVNIIENIQNNISGASVTVSGQDGVNCLEWLNNFAIGDTLVLALHQSYSGNWALYGCGLYHLDYSNGNVSADSIGNLNGLIDNQTTTMSYQAFKNDISTCAGWDVCQTPIVGPNSICGLLLSNFNHPIKEVDCDGDGVNNEYECLYSTDPEDPCDYNPNIITLPVTADQTVCYLPDLTPTITILPGNISGVSIVDIAIEVTELNQSNTDSTVVVRLSSDPRLSFTWDTTLTSIAFITLDNAIWIYNGDNGIYHSFYLNDMLAGGTKTAFGFRAIYDPQSTSGQTTISSSIVPVVGGEYGFTNNTDSETLIYFY